MLFQKFVEHPIGDKALEVKPQKGGGSQTIQQKADPWGPAQPFIKDIFGQAQDIFNQGPQQYYPGQTYADLTPTQNMAMDLITQRALNGSPVTNSAQGMLTNTLNGDFLHGGSGFNAAYNAAANKIIPQVQSHFASSGRLNSGLAQTAMTKALGDSFASQYGQERNNQMQAAMLSPQLASTDYQNLAALQGVGQQQQAQNQLGIDESVNRFNYNQNAPLQNLQNYANLLYPGAGLGSVSSSTTPLSQNRAAGMLGGGLAGLGAMGGLAAMTGGSVPALAPLVGALGGPLGAAATWGLGGALAGGLL